MKKVRINVTVPDATSARLKSVKAALVSQGVEVESVLEAIGIITGQVASSKASKLKVDEATVELEESVQLPPPDAPVQ